MDDASPSARDGPRAAPPPPVSTNEKHKVASRLLFLFVRPLFARSAQRPLSFDDLSLLGDNITASTDAATVKRFHEAYAASQSLSRAVWRTERRAVLVSGALSFVAVVATCCTPLLLFQLLTVVMRVDGSASGTTTESVPALLAMLYAAMVADTVLREQARLVMTGSSTRVTTGIRTVLFEDALLTPTVRAHGMQTAVATIATLYSSNVPAIAAALQLLHGLWMAATQLMVLLLLLNRSLHVSARMLASSLVGVCLIMLLLSSATASRTHSCTKKRQRTLAAVTEAVKSIQAIKLQAWESKMFDKIAWARAKEERKLNAMLTLRCLLYCAIWESPGAVSVVILTSLASSTSGFSPATAFTALVLFEQIRREVYAFTHALRHVLEGKKGVYKMDKYLRMHRESQMPNVDWTTLAGSDSGAIVRIERTVFCDARDPLDVILLNVNLQVRAGELVVVHGPAGAGKTTLLKALLGEATRLRGRVFVSSACRIAYCSEDVWLQSLSIRDNILFGAPLDHQRYARVLDACCLVEDIETFENGDATVVGPKGINLSGGQRARIALARALYADADLYLLDAPLSTSDAIVQSDMFRKCFLELLKHKAVVVTTHNPEVISSEFADRVWHVSDLRVVETVKDPRSAVSRRVRRLTSVPPWRSTSRVQCAGQPTDPERSFPVPQPESVDLSVTNRSGSANLSVSATAGALQQHMNAPSRPRSWQPYSGGDIVNQLASHPAIKLATPRAVVLMYLYGALLLARNFWLAHWSDVSPITQAWAQALNPAFIYGALIASTFVSLLLATFAIFFAIAEFAGSVFRDTTLSLLGAPMYVFYHAQIGDILTRYSQNLQMTEAKMAYPVVLLLRLTASLLASLGTISYHMGTAVGVTFVAAAVTMVRLTLRDEARLFPQMQALCAALDAGCLTFVSESLDGASTIRSFGSVQLALASHQHRELIYRRAHASAVLIACQSWAKIRSSLCAGVPLLLLGILLMWSPDPSSGEHRVPPSALGLVIFCAFTAQRDLASLSVSTLEVVSYVDKVRELFELQQLGVEEEDDKEEGDYKGRDKLDQIPEDEALDGRIRQISVGKQWPPAGEIVFDDVWFRYDARPSHGGHSEPHLVSTSALRGVTFRVRAGEKVGVVGRTGSGKSSLVMALFRMHELSRGRITIDGVDISRLKLRNLRSSLRVIPQSPLFYRCSVRTYLDPFDEFDDAALWRVLRTTGLAVGDSGDGCLDATQDRVVVRDLGKKLSENGSNWSVGERQMLALARALLAPSRVLVLDEAFSSLDQRRDKQLLDVVATEFACSTVFLMTHRLDQVLQLDRIMVMRAGHVVETGTAQELVSNPDSAFYEFLETTLLTF